MSGKKILLFATSLSYITHQTKGKSYPNQNIDNTLCSNRSKVIQLKFHYFNQEVYNLPGRIDFNIPNNIVFADFKYPSPLIIRTDPFRHVTL